LPETEEIKTTEPFNSMLARVSAKPAWKVSLALSLEYKPVLKAAKAKIEDTTTKAKELD